MLSVVCGHCGRDACMRLVGVSDGPISGHRKSLGNFEPHKESVGPYHVVRTGVYRSSSLAMKGLNISIVCRIRIVLPV